MSHHLTAALVEDLGARTVEGRIAPGERLPSETGLTASAAVRLHLANSLWRLDAEAGGPGVSGDAPERG